MGRGDAYDEQYERAVQAVAILSMDEWMEHIGEKRMREVLWDAEGEALEVKLAEEYADPECDEETTIEKDREERLT